MSGVGGTEFGSVDVCLVDPADEVGVISPDSTFFRGFTRPPLPFSRAMSKLELNPADPSELKWVVGRSSTDPSMNFRAEGKL